MPLKYKVGDIVETIKGIRYYIYSFDLDDSGDYNCGKLTEKEWNIWSCLYDKGITKKVPLDQLTPQELINLSQYQAALLGEHKFGWECFKERIKEWSLEDNTDSIKSWVAHHLEDKR